MSFTRVVIFGATGIVAKGLLECLDATTTVNIGRTMIEVAASGYSEHILLNDDINRLATAAESGY